MASINVFELHQIGLVLRLVTICGRANHLRFSYETLTLHTLHIITITIAITIIVYCNLNSTTSKIFIKIHTQLSE